MEARADASGSGATSEKGRCAYIHKTRVKEVLDTRYAAPFGFDIIYVFKHLRLNIHWRNVKPRRAFFFGKAC